MEVEIVYKSVQFGRKSHAFFRSNAHHIDRTQSYMRSAIVSSRIKKS